MVDLTDSPFAGTKHVLVGVQGVWSEMRPFTLFAETAMCRFLLGSTCAGRSLNLLARVIRGCIHRVGESLKVVVSVWYQVNTFGLDAER